MTPILTHLLAAYAVLAAPWLGRVWYERAKRRIASGDPLAKVKLYRALVVEQILMSVLVLGLWYWGGISAESLGLVAPHSWTMIAAVGGPFLIVLLWQTWRLRPMAAQIKAKIKDSVGALLPETNVERKWFGAVSVGAGISEELLFRGFLFYYLSLHVPRVTSWEKVVLTALVFAAGHIYQGWKGSLGTGFVGILLAVIYVMTGSLLLPMIVHAVVDYRVLLMFPPETAPVEAS